LLNRNAQELDIVVEELWDELQGCAFVPADFEVQFGVGGKMPPIEITGSKLNAELNGFVDRVDVWQEDGRNYFRVVDYKTGKKDFDYCDVYNGIGLQMLLYLFALARGGKDILGENPYPAGVQYFPARAPLVSADGALSEEEAKKLRIKEWKRKGLLLCDNDVLNAMQPDGAPQRLDYRVNKDGQISGAVASRDQFRFLEAYITKYLRQMVDTIATGNVEANPYTRGNSHNACAYCPYKQVCNPEQVECRREYAAMKPEDFWERIERSVNADA
jgi:ATP-dependent helicase/nuclease subunit B